MSHAILNVVYGIPLCDKFGDEIRMSNLLREALEDEDVGFLQYYSAYDSSPAAFGVSVGSLYEGGLCEVSELVMLPTPEKVAEFTQHWNSLDKELQTELAKLGTPRVFFLWSSS